MIKWLWGKIEPYVNAKITMRILMFHDAMIERGQIKPIEKPRQPKLTFLFVASRWRECLIMHI